mgnify:CR=1 FL=1
MPGSVIAGGRGVGMTRVGGGRWRVTRPWPPALRPFLHSYAGYWEATVSPFRVRLVPTGRAVLVISLGAPFAQVRRLDQAGPAEHVVGSLIAGLEDGPRVLDHPGGQEAIRIELTPLGAYRLFAMPMRELTNQVVELPHVLGPRSAELVERLAATGDWAESAVRRAVSRTCPDQRCVTLPSFGSRLRIQASIARCAGHPAGRSMGNPGGGASVARVSAGASSRGRTETAVTRFGIAAPPSADPAY